MNGAFITVEGADGAGKTTHADFIEHWLQQQGVNVMRTREPGGTALGEMLREIILDGGGVQVAADAKSDAPKLDAPTSDVPISDRSELMLIFAARTQHLDEVVLPAMEAGRWVLCDRFTDATYAYQGGGRGLSSAAIEALEEWVQGAFQPDLTVLLDVPAEVGLARTSHRGGAQDRFERETLAFKQAVRRAYLERAVCFGQRIKRVDANLPLEQVRGEIKTVLEAFWRERQA